MNALDRIIAGFAPRWGLSRAQARAQLALVREYEAAQQTHRTDGWRTTASGAVKEVRAGRPLARDRARDLVRNNAWGARAVRIKVANTIGTGIMPRADTGSTALNEQIDTLHAEWAAECAPESGGDLYGCQLLADRTRTESGEALILFDRTHTIAPAGVPLVLQVVEGDWLADTTDVLGRGDAAFRDGISFNERGLRTAYRLYRHHPSDSFVYGPNDTRDVPAADLVHLFCQDRPGQIRGMPDLVTVAMRMRDLDDYHDAALLLAKVQAVLGAFVTQPPGAAGSPLGAASTDGNGNRLEELAPGMIGYLAPGEDVKFLSPQGAGPFADYTRAALHLIAAGFGITYHQLTGDLREANYSSLRAGSLEFRRQVEQYQHLVLIPMLLRPIWRAFLTQAVLAGKLPGAALNAPAKWTPPRFELVDPIRDTEAIKAQVRAGLMTWPDAVSEMGFDPTRQLDEIATWQTKIRGAGVILDTDPSLTTANGQPVNPAATSSVVLGAQGNTNA